MTATRLAKIVSSSIATLAAAMLWTGPASSKTVPFTVDDVMGTPYPSDLRSAPTGGAVAWVFSTNGVRNIWVGDGTAKPLVVTSFTQDGYGIADLAWSPDSRAIAFMRGGSVEDSPPANIDSLPDGKRPREVWVAGVVGGIARKLGVGHSPAFSPDGSRIAFADKSSLFVASASATGVPETLLTDSGGITALVWSPDSASIAFVSSRGSHDIVGLYTIATKSIRWLAPSLDHDMEPIFAPDGKSVAFIRIADEKHEEFTSRLSGEPWSIWVADVATGTGHAIWTAPAGAGSVFEPSLSDQDLLWAAGDRLVFVWEKNGWLNPYSVSVAGGAAKPIAMGPFELAAMALSPDRRTLIFSSNQDDLDRAHVWTAELQTDRVREVVHDEAIETYPQMTAAGRIVALRSSGTEPLQPVTLADGGWKPLAPDAVSAAFPRAALVAPHSITFQAKDGQLVHAQIFLPKTPPATGPRPAILFFHGGPRRQMLLGFHPMGAYNWMYAFNQSLVAKGYVVVSVNYRGGIGYGQAYREAKDFGPGGGSELNDLLGAVSYLKSRKDIDPQRIGIWGMSYGGLMTALGLSRASDQIAAGVDIAGLYNWDSFLKSIELPTDGAEEARIAVASSPIATIDKWKSPVLLIQADDDRNVPSGQATELMRDLRSHATPHEIVMIPNEIHDMARYATWMQAFGAASTYLDAHLGKDALTRNHQTPHP
jgi:dipeptidyl aminopeptidase/acylaminoacyl peptidase